MLKYRRFSQLGFGLKVLRKNKSFFFQINHVTLILNNSEKMSGFKAETVNLFKFN